MITPARAVTVPSAAFQDRQMILFQDLLCNNAQERAKLSNAVPLWDVIPRYSSTSRTMAKLRDKNGFLPIRKFSFVFERIEFHVEIHPALVEKDETDAIDGGAITKAFYPSASDEVVEDVLVKLATEQGAGFFSNTEGISGVSFSLYQLRKELAKVNHAKSYKQILQSLHILSRSIIQIEGVWKGEKIRLSSPYLPRVISVCRDNWLKDPHQRWQVHFHPLIHQSIANRTYRQYNYITLLKNTKQLTRWLYKYLIFNYVYASCFRPFEIQFSRIKRDSKLLDGYSRAADSLSECASCLNELQKNGVIKSYRKSNVLGSHNRVVDVVYELIPTQEFVKEVKATNLRSNPKWAKRCFENR